MDVLCSVMGMIPTVGFAILEVTGGSPATFGPIRLQINNLHPFDKIRWTGGQGIYEPSRMKEMQKQYQTFVSTIENTLTDAVNFPVTIEYLQGTIRTKKMEEFADSLYGEPITWMKTFSHSGLLEYFDDAKNPVLSRMNFSDIASVEEIYSMVAGGHHIQGGALIDTINNKT